jgi:hypothetical protein
MTLNGFKKAAQERPISLELLWRNGETSGFAPWLCGIRRIMAVRSYGFDLALNTTEGLSDPEQKTSALRVERSALFQLDGDILSIYKGGSRPATEDEQEAMDSWARKAVESPDASYWGMVRHFRSFTSTAGRQNVRRRRGGRGYEYLIQDRRREIDPDTGRELVFDKNVRGELALKYRVIAA